MTYQRHWKVSKKGIREGSLMLSDEGEMKGKVQRREDEEERFDLL